MRNIKNVLKFELGNFFGSKSYMISTIILALLCVIIMFVPRIKESITGDDTEDSDEIDEDDMTTYALYDETQNLDTDSLAAFYPSDVKWEICDSKKEVEELVSSEEAEQGYVVHSMTSYDIYIFNKGMYDDSSAFNEYMTMENKMAYCEANDINFEELMALDYMEFDCNENILGKDSTDNYWYCYVLVILIFMIIIMYGTTIATGVANEKGNRSIEIMVTTTSPNSILFGKVFAGAIAALFQVGIIAFALLFSYQLNEEYWGEAGRLFLNIPGDVLAAFAVFGLGGFLIYAFMYGALGALVSKVEDLNKSAGTAQMLVMIVYFIVLLQLTNVDGVLMKVCSFLPISSYSAMFARIAMGRVAAWEIVVSAVILYLSVIGMGIIGGKIFRNSTLRMGNPIKISTALKELKKAKTS